MCAAVRKGRWQGDGAGEMSRQWSNRGYGWAYAYLFIYLFCQN